MEKRKKLKADKKEKKKNEIIRASIGLMFLKGYNSTSVKDITDAASIPKGSFYNYFRDKEYYAVDAVKFYQTEIIREYTIILEDKTLTPLNRIKVYLNKIVNDFSAHGFKLGCFAANLSQEMGDISPAISNAIKNFFEYVEILIFKNLLEAKEKKEINISSEKAAKCIASQILSGLNGSILRAKASRDRAVLDEFIFTVYKIILK